MESKKLKLPKNIIFEILGFMTCEELFKYGCRQLNKAIYFNENLQEAMLSQMVMRRLGIIDDTTFETQYLQGVLRSTSQELDCESLSHNYKNQEKQQYSEYFKNFNRKHSRQKYLFGYQSIGGTEITNQADAHFENINIKNVFVDNDGIYCSSTECDPCIVSGIFYEDPLVDIDNEDEFQRVFEKTFEISKKHNFNVILDENQINGNAQYFDQAKQSRFIDFRTKRQLIDKIKEKIIKHWKHPLVLNGLIREIIFLSTKQVNTPSMRQVLKYENAVHKSLSVDYMIAINRMYVALRGPFTCPVRSMFLFVHNQDDLDLKNHPLVKCLKSIKTKDELLEFLEEARTNPEINYLLPKHVDMQKFGYDAVEFEHSFYIDKFSDKTRSDLELFRLRLCAFIDVKDAIKQWISFSQFFACRFVSVLFTNINNNQDIENQIVQDSQPNYDIQTIYFDGVKIPSLFNFDTVK
eukprot:403370075